MCFNCLGGNHTVYDCLKQTNCRVCRKRHHTLLHQPKDDRSENNQNNAPLMSNDNVEESEPVVSLLSTKKLAKPRQVLLATAIIKAQSTSGETQEIRALLDQGSQASFITEAAVQHLRLKRKPVNSKITGLGGGGTLNAKYMVELTIQSRIDPAYKIKLNAYVLNRITSYLPERHLRTINWTEVHEFCLADPQFNTSNKIDILLGAEVYSQVLVDGMKKSPKGNLIAQSTKLGWIISGVVDSYDGGNQSNNITVMHTQVSEDDVLKRFWEVEEQIDSAKKMLTEEEQKCEKLYTTSTTRTDSGRYIVKLPFRDGVPSCEESNTREVALKRFHYLEKKFEKNPKLKRKYTEVIEEYLQLDHMRPVNSSDVKQGVYLPHHAIIRDDKSTTKVRVVVDASCKYDNGLSLNDTLMIGPTLQPELRHIILKWRTFPIGIVADIIKMYRQVRVSDKDVRFQRIVWRGEPDEKIKDYEFLTVLFGTASAPYLAVRSLNQIAYDEGENYPAAADKVVDSFYMDDLMTGAHTIEEGVEIYKQMKALLTKGGFQLQKWNSNHGGLLKIIKTYEDNDMGEANLKANNKEQDAMLKTNLDIKFDSTIKILGLTWDRTEDSFQYTVELPPKPDTVTKRSIISDISRLFDPLGWLAPCIIVAKIYIQKLWLAGLGWDQKVPTELLNEWNNYRKELPELARVKIPRWMGINKDNQLVELHGFSDASKQAYAAVIYVRRVDLDGKVHVALLVAKTRVAPIKQISIPRLELCAATLLTRLLKETMEVLRISKQNVKAWTDSSVVLAWLNSHPSRWNTFVGNRVSEILTSLDSSQWFHVSTKNNPADVASRGLPPAMLADHKQWLSGPQFLREKQINYTKTKDSLVRIEESVQSHLVTVDNSLLLRFSKLQKLLRVMAYCRRFLKYKKGLNRYTSYLKGKKIHEALKCCIKLAQREEFGREYTELKQTGDLKTNKASKLKSLRPYLDESDIIRVGGRLQKSALSEGIKHPVVLPYKSPITSLIVAEAHEKTLHGGQQLMHNYLRTNGYWIIRAKNLIKFHVRKCVVCVRQNAISRNQLMGSLPSVRCTPARPFLYSGLDYAGPIYLRTTKGRGHRSYKGYICLFVCMATRAIHLEVVSDMTTESFLSAFRRFVARRGHCAKLYSDNGTTFVGAAKELKELVSLQPSIVEHLESQATEWHFIPPHAPNFGGLWEAGVKSVKHHLRRVIGDSKLTFEEMSTLLSQVEACLNSRPMTVINTENPEEDIPLTPAHFLIGESLLAVPDHSFVDSNIGSLKRWQFIQKMMQQFWYRWSNEYLANLYQRYKWTSKTEEPKVGDIVLVKEDNLPPSRWLIGRVLVKHPGLDNVTRVVTLQTKSSTIIRSTSKLCILPVAN